MKPFVWLFAVGVASVCAAACSSQRSPAENLGVTSEALFAMGVPCSTDTQCTSTHCVDGVCCDTACGGGARDLEACSNVYGKVTGLVDGTCHTLAAGDACGSLETLNPCTWRGTVVNGGNNCPNPPGGSSACFPCTTAAQCTGAFPVCVGGACVQCDGNAGGGTPAACPSTAPVCAGGVCVGCSAQNPAACSGTTPACDVPTSSCVACNGDFGSASTHACPSATAPACLGTGACGQCSATNATACSGTTAACNTTTNQCTACTGDNGTTTVAPCPTAANPYCFGTGGNAGACGKCTQQNDCNGHPAGSQCNTTTGACGTACTDDTQCTATQWCAGSVCIAKTANGQPIPSIAPVNGTCTTANGIRVCESAVCDPADNRCGLQNGATCGPPPTNGACRSGVCFTTDNKCGLPAGQTCTNGAACRTNVCSPSGKCGNCNSDTTCGAANSGQVCDDLEKTCKAGCRGTGGNGCGPGQACTSTDSTIGACVACRVDTDCGNATSGKVCNVDTRQCQAGCRGAGGNGCPSGQECSSKDGSLGTCSALDGGGDAGACKTDADCGDATSGKVCDDTLKTCVSGCRAQGGNGCPSDKLCTSQSNVAGTCFDKPPPEGDQGSMEGGGVKCAVSRAAGTSGPAWLLVALGALALRRRRPQPRGRR